MKVAYEAGPFGFWLSDKLIEDNIEAMVVPPSLIPIESGNRVKTDKRDSRKLARLLESNMLKQGIRAHPGRAGAPGSLAGPAVSLWTTGRRGTSDQE